MVDLHRSLPGAGVDDERLWSTLAPSTEEIELGGLTVRALSQPGRLMHAALHAAQHGGTGRDSRIDITIWRAAANLAASLEAEAAFAQGLAMLPAGVELVDRLGLDPAPAIDVELRAAGAAEALTFSRLHRTQGLPARAALVWHKLFPPATFMRKWSPLARHGRLGLAVAYVYRPVWVARRFPRALRAWREARAAVTRQADANVSSKTPKT